MKANNLNISQCHFQCIKCKVETDFPMFESGAGGDIETYIDDFTGTIYRLDMHQVYYLNQSAEKLLKPAIEAEDGEHRLRHIPNQVICKVCKSIFSAAPITLSDETKVNAVEL